VTSPKRIHLTQHYAVQVCLQSHFSWSSSLCYVITERLITVFFFLLHRIALYRGVRWCGGGGRKMLYVAARKLLGSAAKERRHSLQQFLRGSRGYRMQNGKEIKCYCLRNPFEYLLPPPTSFPLPPLSPPYKPEPGCCQICSWCSESNTLKTATPLNPPASHQLSDVACAHVFVVPASSDGQRWWRAGAAVISVSGTTEDSALRNVLGLWVCEWVVSCGKHPRAKRRVVSFTPRTALLPENEKPMSID
jgi:hypothetical protein